MTVFHFNVDVLHLQSQHLSGHLGENGITTLTKLCPTVKEVHRAIF